MKREVTRRLFGLWLCCTLWASSCGRSPDPAQSLAGLQVDQTRLVLPTVTFGKSTTGVYHLYNPTDHPLRITRVGPPNCDCTTLTLRFPDRPDAEPRMMRGLPVDLEVLPGEHAEIEVLFDTSRNRQPVSRRVESFVLAVADTPGLVLEYAVDVWTPFWLEPWSQDLGTIGARQRATAHFSVKGHDDQRFGLVVPAEVDGWTIEVQEFVGARVSTYSIQVTAPAELPYGTFSEEFPLRTDLPESPELSFVVRGTVVDDLHWTPLRVVFRPGGELEKGVVLRSRSASLPIHLLDGTIEGLPTGLLQLDLETVEEGMEYRARLLLANSPPQRSEGQLVLLTDYPDRERVEIPIVLLPDPNAH